MPCILLHRVGAGSELKEVATAILIQPLTRDMHNTRMSEEVMRVTVTEVVPEFPGIDPPPMQPLGADKHMVLGDCSKWLMEWPKTQIRLGEGLQGVRRTGGATSRHRPPVVRPSPKTDFMNILLRFFVLEVFFRRVLFSKVNISPCDLLLTLWTMMFLCIIL